MLATFASTCLKYSRNLGPTFWPSPIHILPPFPWLHIASIVQVMCVLCAAPRLVECTRHWLSEPASTRGKAGKSHAEKMQSHLPPSVVVKSTYSERTKLVRIAEVAKLYRTQYLRCIQCHLAAAGVNTKEALLLKENSGPKIECHV